MTSPPDDDASARVPPNDPRLSKKAHADHPSESLLDHWRHRVRDHKWIAPLLAFAAVVTLIASFLGGIQSLAGTLNHTYRSITGAQATEERNAEYDRLTSLQTGPISALTAKLGGPDIKHQSDTRPDLKEYVWIRRIQSKVVAFVLARTNRQGQVWLLSVTSLAKDFTPTFRPPVYLTRGRRAQITLNRSRISDILYPVLFAASGSGAHANGYYFEALPPLGAIDFRAYSVGVSGLGMSTPLSDLAASSPIAGFDFQDPPDRVADRFLAQPKVRALRRSTVIDTYATTYVAIQPETVGAPTVDQVLLSPYR
jgi:hypothetical protein